MIFCIVFCQPTTKDLLYILVNGSLQIDNAQSALNETEYSPESSETTRSCTFCFRGFVRDGFTYIDPEDCNAFQICIKGCMPFGPPYPLRDSLVARTPLKVTLSGFDDKNGYFIVEAKEFNSKKIKIRGTQPAPVQPRVIIKKASPKSSVDHSSGISEPISNILVSNHDVYSCILFLN